jgi:ABC-2 type transport system ATP-binding protein
MENALEIRGVGKHYDGFDLQGISLDLPRGVIMGLVGSNGAGKTTLIKLILNLIRRDGGSIRVLGRDNLAEEAAVKARIGYVPDEPRFHEDATVPQLASAVAPFYSGWDQERFETLMEEFDLPRRKKFKKLSHGTKTKAALALALAHRPDLVLLDEPTSGLDPVFRRMLLDLLAGILQDSETSVLISTHITADLERIADYVTFLKDGGVVLSETMDRVAGDWAVVKGSIEGLDGQARALFQGLRVEAHGFEGLTYRAAEARRVLKEGYTIERASLEDIMVLYGREAAGHD